MPRPSVFVVLASLALVSSVTALARFPQPGGDKPFVQETTRGAARVVWFGGNGVAGEYSLDYGRPQWKSEYDADFDKLTKGKRLRLGADWWTRLDTIVPLEIGGKEVKPECWFLALERSDKGDWFLVLLDQASIRKQKQDAFGSAQTTGGIKAPMESSTPTEAADTLTMRFVADEKDSRLQTLEIRFGKHLLTTKVKAKV